MEMSGMKTKILFKSLLIALFALAWAAPALAQSELTLGVSKTFGYNSGSQIRGTFTLSVRGANTLQSVTYLIDGKPMQPLTAAPFEYRFDTTSYADGWHALSASALTSDGRSLTTDVVRLQFVSAAEEQSSMSKIILPILGLVAVIILGTGALQFVTFRRGKNAAVPLGTEREYGIAGGAICPRCGRPFALHVMTPHFFNGKYETCPNCGRSGLFYRVPLGNLRQAEAAELKMAQAGQPVSAQSEEDKLRQQLDDSRYDDHC
jgi:hypothetical protein